MASFTLRLAHRPCSSEVITCRNEIISPYQKKGHLLRATTYSTKIMLAEIMKMPSLVASEIS